MSGFRAPLGLVLFTALLTCNAPWAAAELRRMDPDVVLPQPSDRYFDQRLYIVQLKQAPAMAYAGGIDGMASTRAQPGSSFDADASAVRNYRRYLTARHDELLLSVGAYQEKVYGYQLAFNGFAARLTPAQAQKLRAKRDVARVWEDQLRYLYTNDSPAFLGLFDAGSGLRTGLGLRGEGVVIGVIDSGIDPDHPSFTNEVTEADIPSLCQSSWAENSLLGRWLCYRWRREEDQLEFEPLANWRGSCEAGEQFESTACNGKIIGARYYVDGFLSRRALDAGEFLSPRDADGHGTHIASTAAGKEVQATIGGNNVARIAGVAPRARIAVYKACWLEPGQTRGTCSTADLQRAIEDAVADGVQIINYSVGNTDISISDPDDLALLTASNAGVLGVVAGGNDGPTPGTILSPSGAPWVLTVAASSRAGQRFDKAIRVQAPAAVAADYPALEASFTPSLANAGPITGELVLVNDELAVIQPGEIGSFFDACEPILNGGELNGQIAFLQRGVCDFQDKLLNAQAAGASAAVVFDNQGGPIVMDGVRNGGVNIPAVMISQANGELLLDSLNAGSEIEVTLNDALVITQTEEGDTIGEFSSRGPNLTAVDILKPDITAPGVDILAAQTPLVANGVRGEQFQYLSGTSMSVPHVAGVAALLKEARPGWGPAALRSALMTTARQDLLKEDGATPADAFDFGAGHIVPNAALNPGLLYLATPEDYDAFLCGTGAPRLSDPACLALETDGFSTRAPDLNLPSIAHGNLVFEDSLTRRVYNSGPSGTYTLSVDPPPGIDVTVAPTSLTLNSGAVGEFEVTLTSPVQQPDTWRFGALTWSDGAHDVRSPLAVRPVDFLAPLEVTGNGLTGTITVPVKFGYDGNYAIAPTGLVAADVISEFVADDPLNSYAFEPVNALLPLSVARFALDVDPDDLLDPTNPADTDDLFLRFALFNEETDGNDDLDLYVYFCSGDDSTATTFQSCDTMNVLSSFNEDSNEQVDVFGLNPGDPLGPGTFVIDVHGFDTDPVAGGPGANFQLFAWRLQQGDDAGNLNITGPAAATAGQSADVQVGWTVPASGRYLGGLSHVGEGGTVLEFTTVRINP